MTASSPPWSKDEGAEGDDAHKAGTDIGPVVDPSQLAQDLGHIGIAKAEGWLLQGGEALAPMSMANPATS